jgi:mono/diheme cytochrome c family protein
MKWMESRLCRTLLVMIFSFFVVTLVWSASSEPPTSAATKLTDKELKGKSVFMKQCALCHLPPPETKPKMRPSSGPILNGLLKGAKPGKEELVRGLILKGTPRMPGFQYTLDRSEIDDLMAFLKTLDDLNAYMNGL